MFFCLPAEANVGAVEINEPLKSGRATSVMYTIAGLVPIAEPRPVNILPANRPKMLLAVAIAIHPITHGMAANFIVFKRPIYSIRKPANKQPTGTDSTITDATHDD